MTTSAVAASDTRRTAPRGSVPPMRLVRSGVLVSLGVFGAALFYGDSVTRTSSRARPSA